MQNMESSTQEKPAGEDPNLKKPNYKNESDSERSVEHGESTTGMVSADNTSLEPQSGSINVPRSKRRGLLGQLTVIAEVEDCRTYSRRTKWVLTVIVAVAALPAPMGSAIFFPSLVEVEQELRTSATLTNLSVALYLLSMAIFPLWWSSFSEVLGRRSIYVVSFCFLAVFNVLSAFSTSISMLTITRFLSGGASASVQAVGAGTIADLWEPKERGRAMSYFFLGPLCGPLLAPIIGGALADRWGWRSTLWFMLILGGAALFLIVLFLPETLNAQHMAKAVEPPTEPLSRKALITKSCKMFAKRMLDPFKILYFLRFPAVFLTVYYASITYGILTVLNISIQDSFSKSPYNFSQLQVGLLYIPDSIGYLLVGLFGGKWMDKIMHREATKANRYDEKGTLIYQPEDRMRENAWIGALLYPSALLWYGWTVDKGVFWLAPMFATFFFGIGSMLIFAMTTTMLSEFMPKSTSGVALAILTRNLLGFVGAVVASPILRGIGNGWLFTILAMIGYASASVILAIKVFGVGWRKTMNSRLI